MFRHCVVMKLSQICTQDDSHRHTHSIMHMLLVLTLTASQHFKCQINLQCCQFLLLLPFKQTGCAGRTRPSVIKKGVQCKVSQITSCSNTKKIQNSSCIWIMLTWNAFWAFRAGCATHTTKSSMSLLLNELFITPTGREKNTTTVLGQSVRALHFAIPARFCHPRRRQWSLALLTPPSLEPHV